MTNYSNEYVGEYVAALKKIDYEFWKQVSDDYSEGELTPSARTGLTIIQNKGFLLDINPNSPKELVALIEERIENFDFDNPDYEKLATIFDLIQAWGGKTGRGPYVISKSRFRFNEWQDVYLEGARLAQTEKHPKKALEKFEEIESIRTSYASKHLRFWSDESPILDIRMSLIFTGKAEKDKWDNYDEFLSLLENLRKSWGCSSLIEVEKIIYTFSKNYFTNGKLKFNKKLESENDYEIAQEIIAINKRQHPKK